MRRLAPVLALGLAGALAAQPDFDGLVGGGSPATTSRPSPLARLAVPGFDPVRDVPHMENWVPKTDFDGGAAHCYAMSMLTVYFFERVAFTGRPGTALTAFTDATPATTPLKLDEDGLLYLFQFLGTRTGARLAVGEAAGLNEFTRPGLQSEVFFRRVAEAIQFSMQIPTNIGRYLRNIAFASIDLIDTPRFRPDGINRAAYEALKARLAAGRLAPFTAHPSRPRADGHVLVAHALDEDAATATFTLYDSNYPPEAGVARPGKLVVDKARWTYRLENHAGRTVYGEYQLLTALRPDRAYEKWVYRRISTHLDEYLWMNRKAFELLADGQNILRQLETEWVPRYEEKLARMKARCPRRMKDRLDD